MESILLIRMFSENMENNEIRISSQILKILNLSNGSHKILNH